MNPGKRRLIYERFNSHNPTPTTELVFGSPFELLVATVLSAQTTDVRVNGVTPALFARYPDAVTLAGADRAELESIIRPTGFYRAKASSLLGLGAALVERFDGQVPRRLRDLVTLPGVGRKTANVVLGNAFGVPGITVDTHVGRLARRFGWTDEEDVLGSLKEVAGGQLVDLLAVDGGVEAEVEAVEGALLSECSGLVSPRDHALLAHVQFVLQEQFKELSVCQIVASGFLQAQVEAGG